MPPTLTQPADGHKPYFAALDGVRAYCVLLVMINHIRANGHLHIPFLPFVAPHRGVDIFFILSGFLITSLLRREQRLTRHIDFAAFYWRRFFRIVPVYCVVLLIYVAITQSPAQHEHWLQLKAGLPWFLTFNNEFAREPNSGSIFMHTWSLGIEEKFYLLWPVLFFFVARTFRMRTLVFVLLFTALTAAAILQAGSKDGYLHGQDYFSLLMGALMAVALSSAYSTRLLAWVARIPPVVALALFLLGFYLDNRFRSVIFGFSALTALFLTHLIARRSWLSAAHACAPMVWLGKRSYSMYLIHILCINVFENRIVIDSAARAWLVLALSYALAAGGAEILYRAVEEPTRNLGRRFLARRTASRALIAQPSHP